MMKRHAGQRVHLIVGRPWLAAIASLRGESTREDPWHGRGSFQPGDVLITVLDTEPRAVLCVERVVYDEDPAGEIVIGEQLITPHLPPIEDVQTRSGATFPNFPGPIPARGADRLLEEIANIDIELSYERRAVRHGPLAAAWIRLNTERMCLLCDVPVDPGDPMVGVHIDGQPEQGVDVDGLLCADCADEMTRSPYTTMTEHRLATRHPQCPRCAAFQTLIVSLGKLQLPPEFAPRYPWEVATTDLISGDETEWHCRACGYGWNFLFPEMLPKEARQREIEPLWERNEDNRIVIAHKHKDGDHSLPASVLCAPLDPGDVMRMLAKIVDTSFAGDWSAALNVIVDRSFSAWEVLDHAINEFSETIGDRARDIRYSGDPTHIAVPGVGIRTDYGNFTSGSGIGVGYGSDDYYDVMHAFVIDDDGNADVLDAQAENDVVVDGRIMSEEDQTWTFSHTLRPEEYRS